MPPYNEAVRAVPMPARITRLPVSAKGFPVPWFVAWFDGEPDFRVVDSPKVERAVRERRCWTCGEPLGRYMAITAGPMCVVNRCISEPPSHRDCAIFAARACPFLASPRMRRREGGLPEERREPPGLHIRRNPGAVAIWITESYRPFRAEDGGVLFSFSGPPVEVLWFAEGQPASRAQIMASIDTGLPILEEQIAPGDAQGHADLRGLVAAAMPFLPAEAA